MVEMNKVRCPKCGSDDIAEVRFVHLKSGYERAICWHCLSCNHNWGKEGLTHG